MLISLGAFIVIIIAGSIIQGLTVGGFILAGATPMMFMVFNAVVVAPMLEEAVKNWFIQKNMPWVGTGVVFGIELVMYVFSIMAAGGSLPAALVARLAGLLMHFGTTAIQKYMMDKDKDKGYDVMPGQQKQTVLLAWSTGVLIHATWNALAIMYSKDLNKLLGI